MERKTVLRMSAPNQVENYPVSYDDTGKLNYVTINADDLDGSKPRRPRGSYEVLDPKENEENFGGVWHRAPRRRSTAPRGYFKRNLRMVLDDRELPPAG